MGSNKGKYFGIVGIQKLHGSTAESFEALSKYNKTLHPPQQGMRVILLGLHIDDFIMIFRINDNGQIELLRIGAGKPGVSIRTPVHGRAYAVAVPQIDIVSHADFVSVVNHRCPGNGKKQAVHQFNSSAVIAQKGGKSAADAQV